MASLLAPLLRFLVNALYSLGLASIIALYEDFAFWVSDFFHGHVITAAQKIAASVGYVAILGGIIMTYLATLNTLMNQITVIAPPDSMVWGASWILPTNTGVCLSIIMTAYTVRFVTAIHLKIVEARFQSQISSNGQ